MKPEPHYHKVTYGRRVEFTIRAEDAGSTSDGGTLWSFAYCEGDVDSKGEHDPDDGPLWEDGMPSLSGKQLQAFALWLVTADPPGIASQYHPTMRYEEE